MSWGQQLTADDHEHEDADAMIRKLESAADMSIRYFCRLIDMETGQIGQETDIGSYAKLANAFIFNGRIKEANTLLDYVINNFLQSNGDFKTQPYLKSHSYPFCVFYPYTNEWLLQAGISLRRYDFVFKASKFIDKFYNPVLHASTIINDYDKENKNNVHCIFNSAALGTTYLYMHNLERAKLIGNTIVKAIEKQSESMNDTKNPIYYLRFNDKFEFIKFIKPEKGKRIIYKINATKVKQPWFAIGYPVAFLGQLYQITGDEKYLATAEYLLDFAIDRCNYCARTNQWAHKLMWGASIVGTITNKEKYWHLCYDIANTIVGAQDVETGKTSNIIDQTAEMAFWLPIISMKIRHTKMKFGDVGTGVKKQVQSKL